MPVDGVLREGKDLEESKGEEQRMEPPVDWLLEGEPFIQYRTRRDLLGEAEGEGGVKSARRAMLASSPVQNLVTELSGWPGTVISSHKSASQPFHKLTFLADLGLSAGDPGMDRIIKRILANQADEGPFQLPTNIPTHYGGSGQDTWGWALCDAPLILYALAKFGLGDEPEVREAYSHVTGLVRENGWPCAVSKELGSFHGPGRKQDPCPFATLAMLKALAEIEELRDSAACQVGADTLLTLWTESRTQHPYIFYMGTDFRKLKVPLVWYDLFHVLEVVSRFPRLKEDTRLQDMLGILKGKMDAQGRLAPESVWAAWKDWEFGQKKGPSRWLTLLGWRLVMRVEG